MRFISLFAGIGGFDLGFERAGFTCVAQVEIDHAARAVLADHWPAVPRFEDVRQVGAHNLPACDVIVGGFPCQDLSIAGKRAGLSGVRSGLFFEMVRVINELQPGYVVWENVPGLLIANRGRDFAIVLHALGSIGFSGGWTMLDSRFFGVAQQRKRVFGCFSRSNNGAERAAEILSFAGRLRGNSAAGQAAPADIAAGLRDDATGDRRIVGSLTGDHPLRDAAAGAQGHLVVGPLTANNSGARSRVGDEQAAAGHLITTSDPDYIDMGDPGDGAPFLAGGFGVRRLMPVECERLQGFPDDWTASQSDSARYRLLGNAVTVPVAEWIGRRLMQYRGHNGQ